MITSFLFEVSALASCGGTTLTWSSTSNSNWTQASNWSPANAPDSSTEDVVIINTGTNSRINASTTVGCVDVQSGTLVASSSYTLNVTGDYFNAPYQNTLNFSSNSFVINMNGTTAQTVNVLDNLRDLTLSNDSEVTLNGEFQILSDWTINSTGKTYITGSVTQYTTGNTTTIPAGHTLVVKTGATLYMRGDLVVNGVLKIEAGALLKFYRNKSLTVNSGGVLQLIGASGNPAKITSEAANLNFYFDMYGTMIANNFLISRPTSNGLNLYGTLSEFDNGEVRGISGNGYGLTLNSGSNAPANITNIGFYNDDSRSNTKNINATNYTNPITVSDYSGDVSGASFETDPNNIITWAEPAVTSLTIVNDAESGEPGTTMNPSTEYTFAEFAFALSQTDVATDITSITLTMTGTASMSDLESVTAYLDSNDNCNYNNTDTSLGTLSFSGYPPTATINLSAGTISPSSTTPKCLIIRAKTDTSPTDQKTVKFGIMSQSDIVNSQNYPVSETSGTPIETGYSTIRNTNYATWDGATSNLWSVTTNWRNDNPPTSSLDCQIGAAVNEALININPVACSNATLQTNGIINWNNSTNSFDIYGALNVASSFSFLNATSGNITFKGANTQSLSLLTDFPGNIILQNTGAVGDNLLNITSNSTINGNFTCTSGVLSIPTNVIFTIKGNLTINSGCTVKVEPGGTLNLGTNSILLVNSGGSLNLVGNASQTSSITSLSQSSPFTVDVYGTIAAKYYSLTNTNGLRIRSSATIDTTNNLSNGSFLYPVSSGISLLTLDRQIPGNALDSMVFNLNGSSASGIINIDTTNAASGILTINNYSGDIAGPSYDLDPNYAIDWQGQTNTIEILAQANAPSSVTVGNTYNMGRYSLRQTLAGASYDDTDITQIILTLTGTGNANDISSVSLYTDLDCDGANGSLVASQNFSGTPATSTFTLSTGQLTIPADLSTTVEKCFYVEYTISSNATNASTVGVKVASASAITNTQNYAFASNAAPPVNTGLATINAPTTTIWTGSTSTAWATASNWSAGVPSSTKTCEIPSVSNSPIISADAQCLNVNITTGSLTINSGTTLSVYGNFINAGSLTQNGTIAIADGGVNLSHNIDSTSTLATLAVQKTGGGVITINDTSLTVNQLTITGSSFRINIPSGKKLILPNGVTIPSGELRVSTGGTLEIGSGQLISVTGGTFALLGTNETFPQNTNKAKVTVNSSGRYGFQATSGTVNLNGFIIDQIDENGLSISGTTNISNLSGGQFTNLSPSYASVKVIQLNTSGSIPASSTNIAWNWGAFNTFTSNANTPANTESYKLVSSTGCNGQSIDFSGWSGDWFEATSTFDVTTKISSTNCNITLSDASSSVALKSFTAKGYSNAIQLLWQTNLEKNHLGFNVYRTLENDTNYQQINTKLLKNISNFGQAKGDYSFTDFDVDRDKTYFYYIEDVEINGRVSLHGPINASVDPDETIAPNPNTGNDDSNQDDNDDGQNTIPGTIKNPSYQDLGNGVVILSQTSKAIKLEITPPSLDFEQSSHDASYEVLTQLGYSQTAVEGEASLPRKTILIDVDDYLESAELIDANISEAIMNGKLIAPTLTYKKINDVLTEEFILSENYYENNELLPNNYFEVIPNLLANNGRKYLKIEVSPVKYNPVTRELHYASKIILDIGFDGNDWDSSDDYSKKLAVNSYANTIKIGVKEEGAYSLTLKEMRELNVNFPIEGSQISDLRLYYQNKEIPIEIEALADTFSDEDDRILFILKKDETKIQYLTLSDNDLLESDDSPLRISHYDGTPNGNSKLDNDNIVTKKFEENFIYIDGESIGDTKDHYFWQQIFNYPGKSKFSEDITINDFDLDNLRNARITFELKGAPGNIGSIFDHHVRLKINNEIVDDRIIENNSRNKVSFDISTEFLNNGLNNIELEVLGTFATNGEYDRIYINNFEIEYVNNSQSNDQIIYSTELLNIDHTLKDFGSSDIYIFNYNDTDNIQRIINPHIYNNLAKYNIDFYLGDELLNDEKLTIFATTDEMLKKVYSLEINNGDSSKIKASRGSELIILGARDLLELSDDFVAHKKSQGLTVKLVNIDDVYNEFSHSEASGLAIKNFIKFVTSNWEIKPRYLLVLGDSSLDPNDYNVYENDDEDNINKEAQTIPSLMSVGRFMDFYSDNNLVRENDKSLLAIGRIPSNDKKLIKNYLQKVIKYENGEISPSLTKKTSFISDLDQGYYENFDKKIEAFATTLSHFNSDLLKYSNYSDKLEMREKIIEEFDSDSFILNFLGHGASDRFGDALFTTNHALQLNNSKLPIVTMWNCEATFFFDPTKSEQSLGESLIFNQDAGAIIFIGAVTQTTPTAQYNYAMNFYSTLNSELKKKYTGQRVGDIFVKTQNIQNTSNYENDIINATVILGDPSLKLPKEYFKAEDKKSDHSAKAGGCSANAGNGATMPWYSGLLELILCAVLIALGRRSIFLLLR